MSCLSDICFVVSQFDIKNGTRLIISTSSVPFIIKEYGAATIPQTGGSSGYLTYTGRQPVPYEKS